MEQEQIVDAVRDWLETNDWQYEYNVERHVIKTSIKLKCKIKKARIYIDFMDDYYLVYLVSPIGGDVDDLGELLKYLTMVNYGLANGNFELDMADGEVRYKIYVSCRDLAELPEAIIASSIYVGCAMMDRYGNGIAALALGFSDAATEIQKAEKQTDVGSGDSGDSGGYLDDDELAALGFHIDLPGLDPLRFDSSDNG